MQLGFVRPRVMDTTLRIYDRALHPELFESYMTGRVATQRFRAVVMISEAGHVAQLTSQGYTLTEVTGSAHAALPSHGLLDQKFLAAGELFVEHGGPVHYHMTGHVDRVDAEAFARLNAELELDARRAFLAYQFPGNNRLVAGPQSVVKVEGSASSLIIHTFHTFPDELAIVRTQSLFEFPGEACSA